MSSTNSTMSLVLVKGYIRRIEQTLNKQIIPSGITNICFEYYRLVNILFLLNGPKKSPINGMYVADLESNKHAVLQKENKLSKSLYQNKIFVQSCGLSIYSNLKFPSSIIQKINNINKHQSKSIIFKCGGTLHSSKTTQECVGYVFNDINIGVNNQKINVFQWELPSFPHLLHGNYTIFNDSINGDHYGLLSIGGDQSSKSTKKMYYLSFNDENYEKQITDKWKWKRLMDMGHHRTSPTCCIINKNDVNSQLIIIGGYDASQDTDLKSVVSYNFNSKTVSDLNDIFFKRCLAAICVDEIDKNRIYIGGGYGACEVHEVEYYDINKNKWFHDIPTTTLNHDYYPVMWLDDNLLYIASTSSNGMEYIDIRDSNRKWIVTKHLASMFGLVKPVAGYSSRLIRFPF